MDFGQAIATGFKKYVTFSGRASRSEYWFWVLFTIIGSIVTGTLDYALFSENDFASPLNSIFGLICFLPGLAVGFRRLHDIGRSGWWWLIALTIIGAIVTLILDRAVFSDSDLSPLNAIFNLVCFLPSLAVAVRRLHDIGRTGWWILIALTIIGTIVLIVWACQKSDSGPNAYGPPPVGM